MKLIVQYNEGLFAQSQGDYARAHENFKRVLESNKYYVDAYLRLADL